MLTASLALSGGQRSLAGEPSTEAFSLLVVGDQGVSPEDTGRHPVQLAVARAMAASDAAASVHALVLLGDNFYPDGLLEGEAVARVRANLVRPYCRFIRFDGVDASEVESACETPAARRRPVPLFATLGNHDHLTPESPALQRAIASRYFSNWRMAQAPAAVHELPGGVSLILFDSTRIFDGGESKPLYDALRTSRGPWRILAAHHPVANISRGTEAERHARYRRVVLDAVGASGVDVQLMLAGHEHNLQLLSMAGPVPRLHAISGGGSGARSLHGSDPNRLAGFEEPGFVRVDLVGAAAAPGSARLRVTLHGLPGALSKLFGGGPRQLARREVDLAGSIRE